MTIALKTMVWKPILKRYTKIRFINNSKNVGFARANNQGAKIASGDFLLFLNPDTTMIEDAVESMLDYIRLDFFHWNPWS